MAKEREEEQTTATDGGQDPASERKQPGKAILAGIDLEDLEDVDRAVRSAIGKSRSAAASAAGSIRDTIQTVRDARDSVVMARVSKDSLQKMDDLVDSGLVNSRSEAAAFLISEGIEARADLYGKIAEQTEVIRGAREKLKNLLTEEPEPAESQGGGWRDRLRGLRSE